MKTTLFFLLVSISLQAKAYLIEPLDFPDVVINENDDLKTKTIASYCLGGQGEMNEVPTSIAHTNKFTCKNGYSEQYLFEAWKSNPKNYKDGKLNIAKLDPDPNSTPGFSHIASNYIFDRIREKYPEVANCKEKNVEIGEEKKIIFDCPSGPVDAAPMIAKMVNPDLLTKMVNHIYVQGEEQSKKNNPSFHRGSDEAPVVVDNTNPDNKNGTGPKTVTPTPTAPVPTTTTGTPTGNDANTTDGDNVNKVAPPTPTPTPTVTENPDPKPDPVPTEQNPPAEEDKDCSEALRQAIAELLADDKKNIIGLQYEVTVLKMTALALKNQTNSLEGFIRKQSKQINEMDSGIIDKMNAMYKAHGLPEDAKSISENLKLKAKTANYKEKNKRFFNDSSSAFLLAYQKMNDNSGIKDSDVSVLWFMDKVSQKAKSKLGNFSSAHNRTNLSTRISQYTGIVNPKVAQSKEVVEDKLKKQKAKVDKEFLSLIEDFKTSNKACYDKLFSDGEDECNLSVVDAQFSQLLAINSKIASTDLISLDEHLRGGIDKARFSINMYVADSGSTNTKKEEPKKEQPKKEEPKKEEVNTERQPAGTTQGQTPKVGEPGYVDPIDQEEIDEPKEETENERLQREEMERIINHD